LYRVRYIMVLLILGTFIWVMMIAATISLPESSDVRLLGDNVQYEVNFAWRNHLLIDVLQAKAGSQAYVVWGLKPADTGNVNNPSKLTI
jgi:hypothetical protein